MNRKIINKNKSNIYLSIKLHSLLLSIILVLTESKALGKSTVFKRGISNNHQFDHFLLERVTDWVYLKLFPNEVIVDNVGRSTYSSIHSSLLFIVNEHHEPEIPWKEESPRLMEFNCGRSIQIHFKSHTRDHNRERTMECLISYWYRR